MATIIGSNANVNNSGSEVGTFVQFLSNPATQIPLDSNFLISFDPIPPALNSGTDLWKNLEYNWNVAPTLNSLIGQTQKQTVFGNSVCLFAQAIDIPGEAVGTERASTPLGGAAGGLIPGVVSTSRAAYNDLTISFLETNQSFIDFFIRPWITLVGHYGLIVRDSASPQNVKTDITVVHFDKNDNQTNGGVRRVFTFYSCAPVNIGDSKYSYGKAEIRVEPVKFVYNNYKISYMQN